MRHFKHNIKNFHLNVTVFYYKKIPGVSLSFRSDKIHYGHHFSPSAIYIYVDLSAAIIL